MKDATFISTGFPSSPSSEEAGAAMWFCLRTQPRREMFALMCLNKLAAVETYLPRIRYAGQGRRHGKQITEALFPSYLFCKFNLRHQTRAVCYAPGVSGLIHFGNQTPTIPEAVIQQLRTTFGSDEPATLDYTLKIGDKVLIESGPMRGLEGLVTRVLPGKTRVALMLEFLGQQTQIELDLDQTQLPADRRVLWLKKN